MAHLKKDTTIGGINVYDHLTKQDRETKTLTHGLNVIEPDQSSPIKVEFYGNTLVNLLGRSLNDPNGWILEDNTNIKDGVLTMMADGSTYVDVVKPTNLKDNAYYLVRLNVIDSKFTTSLPFVLVKGDGYGLSDHIHILPDEKGFVYKTFKTGIISDNRFNMYVRPVEPQGNFIKIKDLAIYEIDEETYNKIGVSLTDEDVERMFPYVDGVQHVRNPYVKVEGENLVPTDVDGWEVGELKWADGEPNNSLRSLRTINYISVKPNTQLTVNTYGDYLCAVFEYDNDKKFVRTWSGHNLFSKRTEIVSEKTKFVKLVVRRSDQTDGITKDEILKAQPMFILGSQPKPFTPHNPSYLYAETTLAGNNDKKDILFQNFSDNGKWKVKREFKTDEVLDGSRGWAFDKNETGYKRFLLTSFTNFVAYSEIVVKYDGKVVKSLDSTSFTSGDETKLTNTNNSLYLTVNNIDSGFTEAMTPSADLIKSYFYGWRYVGDGTNHAWIPIGDEDESRKETDINVTSTTPSPTMQDGTIQPYKLTYQLAEPEIEVVQVEGDLAINGTTQVEVGSGFTYTEDEGGQREYTILPENERYDFTCNLEEVKVTYSKNIRSALDDTIAKLTNNVTDTTILKRQVVENNKKVSEVNNEILDHKNSTVSDDVHNLFSEGRIIEEYGSNANGSYIRFSNGVQICWFDLALSIPPNFTEIYNWTFPAEFNTENPVRDIARFVSGGAQNDSAKTATLAFNVHPDNSTNSRARILMRNNNDGYDLVIRSYVLAIGRWK